MNFAIGGQTVKAILAFMAWLELQFGTLGAILLVAGAVWLGVKLLAWEPGGSERSGRESQASTPQANHEPLLARNPEYAEWLEDHEALLARNPEYAEWLKGREKP